MVITIVLEASSWHVGGSSTFLSHFFLFLFFCWDLKYREKEVYVNTEIPVIGLRKLPPKSATF